MKPEDGRTIFVVDRDGAALGRVHTVGYGGYFFPACGTVPGRGFATFREGLAWLVTQRRAWR